jgi:hypothetical protein
MRKLHHSFSEHPSTGSTKHGTTRSTSALPPFFGSAQTREHSPVRDCRMQSTHPTCATQQNNASNTRMFRVLLCVCLAAGLMSPKSSFFFDRVSGVNQEIVASREECIGTHCHLRNRWIVSFLQTFTMGKLQACTHQHCATLAGSSVRSCVCHVTVFAAGFRGLMSQNQVSFFFRPWSLQGEKKVNKLVWNCAKMADLLNVLLVRASGLRRARGQRPSVVAQIRMLDCATPRCLVYMPAHRTHVLQFNINMIIIMIDWCV